MSIPKVKCTCRGCNSSKIYFRIEGMESALGIKCEYNDESIDVYKLNPSDAYKLSKLEQHDGNWHCCGDCADETSVDVEIDGKKFIDMEGSDFLKYLANIHIQDPALSTDKFSYKVHSICNVDFYIISIQNSTKKDVGTLIDNIKTAMYSSGLCVDLSIKEVLINNCINGKYIASLYYNNIMIKPVKEFATEIKQIIESIKS